MKITLANEAGFCIGVKRALDLVDKQPKPIQVLGQLIHNPQIVEELESKGVTIANTLEEVKTPNIVITAHGVADSVKKRANELNLSIIDATCPLVQRVHNYAKQLEKEGYKVIVIGQPDHVEVNGIVTDLKNYLVIEDIKDIQTIKEKKLGVVVQTTQDINKVNQILNKLKTISSDIKFHDTICKATKNRQTSAEELAKTVDLMLVIGGYNSGNTIRLKEICSQHTTTYHIESPTQLNKEWFSGKQHVGITAGASTPQYLIEEVVEKIKNQRL